MREANQTNPIDVEIYECYHIMKMFGFIEIDKLKEMSEGTFNILKEEIIKDVKEQEKLMKEQQTRPRMK